MPKPKVIVTISETGEVTVEAQCVTGHGCQALTSAIEAALGRTVNDQKKPEFHQQAGQGHAQGAKQGA